MSAVPALGSCLLVFPSRDSIRAGVDHPFTFGLADAPRLARRLGKPGGSINSSMLPGKYELVDACSGPGAYIVEPC